MLSLVIKEENPHVIFLTETKLSVMDTASVYFDTLSYTVYRKEREGTGGGGGVAILVRKDVESTDIQDAVWRDVEATACVVNLGGKRILLGCIYRSPTATSQYNDQVRRTVSRMANIRADQLLLCGDFNYKEIKWESNLVSGGGESEQVKFHDMCQDEYLHQNVQEFTRVSGYNEPSLLDLIFTKNPLE